MAEQLENAVERINQGKVITPSGNRWTRRSGDGEIDLQPRGLR